jgi:hypothetical protein
MLGIWFALPFAGVARDLYGLFESIFAPSKSEEDSACLLLVGSGVILSEIL